jgi:CheY-like chemotaxis protein/anti-sigma regulatory factor (Ser/Thr protein kinase)
MNNEILHIFEKEEIIEDEMKDKYFQMIIHDLKQPLNNIFLITERLQEKNLMKLEKQEYNKIIIQNCETMKALISNVLFTSKLSFGNSILEHKKLKLRNILERSILMCGLSAITNGIDIALEIPLDLPELVYGDDNRLQQILQNLVGNAVKFTTAGSVVVQVKILNQNEKNIKIEVSVIDTGIGISNKDKLQLFNEFYQVKENSEIFRGTGLGLSICKKLTKLMDGDIGVKDGKNGGTEFWFTCKLSKEPLIRKFSFKRRMSSLENFERIKEQPIFDRKRSLSYNGNESELQMDYSLMDDLTRGEKSESINDSSDPKDDIHGLLSFGNIVGHVLVFYKNLNVRNVLRFYLNSLKIKSTFVDFSDYFGSMDPEKELQLKELKNQFIQVVIIDDFYFNINGVNDHTLSGEKIKIKGFHVLKQLKKEIFRHNLTLPSKHFSVDVVYALFSSNLKQDLSKEFHVSVPKPVSLFSITKMAKMLKLVYNEFSFQQYTRSRRSVQYDKYDAQFEIKDITSDDNSDQNYDKLDFKIHSTKRKSRYDIFAQRRRSSVDAGKLKRSFAEEFDRTKLLNALNSNDRTSTSSTKSPLLPELILVGETEDKKSMSFYQPKSETQTPRYYSTPVALNSTLKDYHFPTTAPEESNESKLLTSCLIIDDNIMSQKIMTKHIQSLKINCKASSSGSDGFEIYKESHQVGDKIDVIITDIHMKGLDGIEFTKMVREYEKKNELKSAFIIGVTGDDERILKSCLDAGINKLFFKPLAKADLKELKELILEKIKK